MQPKKKLSFNDNYIFVESFGNVIYNDFVSEGFA
jgi:hypothetical protein